MNLLQGAGINQSAWLRESSVALASYPYCNVYTLLIFYKALFLILLAVMHSGPPEATCILRCTQKPKACESNSTLSSPQLDQPSSVKYDFAASLRHSCGLY